MANPEGPFEVAMTHVSVNGQRSACLRPDHTRSMAARLMAWKDAKESCQSCLSATATRIVGGQALCALCRDQRHIRSAGLEVLRPRLAELREEPTADRFVGHAIVTNALSLDLGGFRERIMPEALTRTFKENIDVRALWNHNSDFPLGRMSAGTLSLQTTTRGLSIALDPPVWAKQQIESVARRDVTGQSFGFRALDDEWFEDGPIPIRHVTDMRVSEISLVSFPAYPDTDVKVGKNLQMDQGRSEAWYKARLRLAAL